MEFIHAKYRNIFAYGNELQEFYFNRNNIKLIIGGNGFGKSSIGKIIKIGTYHEYDGIPVDEIANSINGNGFIEICLNSNNHNWIIQTEFSFTKLKEIRVYKDGSTEPEDWGKIPDTKERIKKEIITVPYYLINNISNLSVDDFQSFLKMDAKNTRNIRDRLFSFFILNEMSALSSKHVNKDLSDYDSMLKDLGMKMQEHANLEEKYNVAKDNAEKQEKQRKKELEDSISKLKKEISGLEFDGNNFNDLLNLFIKKKNFLNFNSIKVKNESLRVKFEQIVNDLNKLSSDKASADENIKKYKELQDYLNNRILAMELKSESKELNTSKEENEKLEQENLLLDSEIKSLQKELQEIKKREFIEQAISIKESILSLDKELKEKLLSQKSTKEELEEKNKDISGLEKQIITTEAEISQLKHKLLLFENDKCPECESDLKGKEQQGRKLSIEDSIKEKESFTESKKEILDKLKEVRDSLKENLAFVDSQVSRLNLSIANLGNKLDGNPYSEKTISEIKDIEINTNYEGSSAEFNSVIEEKQQVLNKNNASYKSSKSLWDKLVRDFEKKKSSYVKVPKPDWYNIDENVKIEDLLTGAGEEINHYTNESHEFQSFINRGIVEKGKMEGELRFNEKELENLKVEEINIESHETIEYLDEEILKVKDKIQENTNLSNEKKVEKNSQQKELDSIGKGENKELTLYLNLINEAKEYISVTEKSQKSLLAKVNFYRGFLYTLSNEGLKSYIIGKIVPAINLEITQILAMLNINITCTFNNEFKPTLYRFGKEASLQSISVGQRKMIDLAIIFSISRILIMKYPQLNFVFYDEIFSSLTSENTNIIINLIREHIAKKLNLQVCIINHAYIPLSEIDEVVEVSQINGFSGIVTSTPQEYILKKTV